MSTENVKNRATHFIVLAISYISFVKIIIIIIIDIKQQKTIKSPKKRKMFIDQYNNLLIKLLNVHYTSHNSTNQTVPT